ncbi:MAG: hypothetical protein GF393_06890 [Armatimonadia bacterium]|nr:hypothetical protein [Armatimonadia bacterium]
MVETDDSPDWQRVADVAAALHGILVWYGLFHFCLVVALILIEPFALRAAAWAGTVISFALMMSLSYQLVMGIDDPAPYLWVALMALPCINLVALLVLNSKGLTWLDPYNVDAGLFGPTKQAIAQLRERAMEQQIERSAADAEAAWRERHPSE